MKRYVQNEFIINEGEEGDYFYILVEGQVECLKNKSDQSAEKEHVRYLSRGDHFGEIALIKDVKRSMSIRVKSERCKALALNRSTFTRVLGDIGAHLKKDYDG